MILKFIYDKKAVDEHEEKFLTKVYTIAQKELKKMEDITEVIQYFPHEYSESEDGWGNFIYPGKTETTPSSKKNIASSIIFDALEKASTIK
ncbi:hypothetical protein C8N46_102176 [Kordia periserrulae]|uniref:Uncharacterized protein n=1 Tax=Kordia periserrulae TaxID=701523 RepID=A0A2T6C378_9FLAO|nr:hypothetical protein [Kordia periserrulae]PTX62776.1 hypothetical protein C8N46_102176 [Kordia periserrulae]